MQETADMELLRQYVHRNSEEAFAALVTRHANMVYSAARRKTGNAHAAEEITQAVFIILAKKADRLRDGTILSGWLYQTARLTSASFLRTEIRRTHREQEAYMQSLSNEPEAKVWLGIEPMLEDAMGRLGETERDALALRFFEGKSFREIGTAVGASENAAKKRVSHALEKLRKFFSKRGVVSTTTIIAGAISANSVQAAPAMLAKSVTAVAIAKGAAASGSTLILIKGALKLMAWTKAKTAVVVGALVVLAAAIVATSSIWISNPESKGIPFEAEGTIVYSASFPQSSYTDTKHFILMTDGNQWKIRTTNIKEESTGVDGPPPSDSIDLYYEMGFDGTNLFTLEQQDPQKVMPQFSSEVIRSGHYILASGRVEKADSPPCLDTYQLCPVWLAYCSASYFAGLKENQAISPMFPGRDFLNESIPPRKKLPAKWTMNGKSFLKDVSWFSDGNVEVHYPNGKVAVEKYAAPYNTAFLQGRFDNAAWTNWNGMSLPTNFKLVVYRPAYTSQTVANFEIAYTITGTIEQIRTLDKFSPVPELTTRTGITDSRLMRRSRPTSYTSTNRWDYSDAIR